MMTGIWWTPYQIPNDHVALEEEKENGAKFCQNIVCIGPCQLREPGNEYDEYDDGDGQDDGHVDGISFLMMRMIFADCLLAAI